MHRKDVSSLNATRKHALITVEPAHGSSGGGWGESPLDPIEVVGILWGLAATRHSPDSTVKDSLIPLPTPCQDFPELLKVASNLFVAEERHLEGQRTVETGDALQMACMHFEVWTAGPSVNDRVWNSTSPSPPTGRNKPHCIRRVLLGTLSVAKTRTGPALLSYFLMITNAEP